MPADSKLVRDLFLAVTELPESDRAAYLQQHTKGDAELFSAVQRLLAAHEQPASVLNHTAPGMPTADYAGHAERPGVVIGPYKLMEQIGEGGFGLVFVAEQTEPVKRRVALKVIKPGMDSSQVIARFEAERQALAMMDHPNIARVLDAGTTDTGRPYFVMELVRGIPITDYCDQNHLTPAERLELFVSVCHAIQHAHQKGIIHRDIKPSNVLVASHDGKPVAKVIDFGVAKAIHQQLTVRTIYTQFAQMIGTPLYMSPEQAEMSGLDIDTRSDIYSLGVLLYELLTGSTPLEREKLVKAAYDEIRRAIREDDPQRPSDRLSASKTLPSLAASRRTEPTRLSRMLKGELDWIVMKALDKDRTRRYESANGMARDIQRYLSDDVVEARPASTGYRLRKFVRRHKGQVLAAALFLFALVLGIIGTSWGLYRAWNQELIALAAQRAEADRAEGERQAKEKAVLEASKASKQAEIAQAVKEFLEKDLIGQADPNQDKDGGKPKDVELKLKTALDRAVPLIGERFQGKPLIEASIRRTIGKAYEGRGLQAEALVQLEKACELYRAELAHTKEVDMEGVVFRPYFEAQMELVMAYHMMGQQQKSRDALQELQKRVEQSIENVEVRKTILEPLALIRGVVDGKDPIKALQQGQDLLMALGEKWQVPVEGAKSGEKTTMNPMTPMNKFFEFQLLIAQKKLSEAEQGLKQQLEVERDPEARLLFTSSLAEVYKGQRKYQDAERVLNQVIQTERAKGESQSLSMAFESLAEVYRTQGKNAEAREYYQKALAGFKKSLGEEHPVLGSCHQGLAMICFAEKNYSQAETEIRAALALYANQKQYKYAHHESTSMLGAILAGQKKYQEAESLLLAGYDGMIQEAKTIPEIRMTLLPAAVDRLIDFYDQTGNATEAARWKKERASLKDETGKLHQMPEKKP